MLKLEELVESVSEITRTDHNIVHGHIKAIGAKLYQNGFESIESAYYVWEDIKDSETKKQAFLKDNCTGYSLAYFLAAMQAVDEQHNLYATCPECNKRGQITIPVEDNVFKVKGECGHELGVLGKLAMDRSNEDDKIIMGFEPIDEQ